MTEDKNGLDPQNTILNTPSLPPDPDHAWKALLKINDWIRQADAKATVTLAFTGALATLLYNMVSGLVHTGVWVNILAVLSTGLLVIAGISCGLTLTPRIKDTLRSSENRISVLFYGAINQHYGKDRDKFCAEIEDLTKDPTRLTLELARQIHINSRIASEKTVRVQWAIRAMVTGGFAIAAIAALIAR
ncbi:Pycsar system effector family protein [Gordonia sp. ABSL49_1]|uniref:Pycsar system effector family protein n=1 Tax=Gordonia sp. ABSL49_1 TaxID=2920941 RepID=UPI001F0FE827|nr:Pycsar system effector family protein [Gordonia sp. ABSL49_1]MCH5644439.1 DUF5706 domain-containing protein [Gordonia sp. ABSL49_1]